MNWTVVLRGDFWLPHLVNMLKEYKGNSEQVSCRDEMIAQIEAQMRGDSITGRTTRPLVVIDPEDDEAVERLWRIWTTLAQEHRLAQDCMQAALREFANSTPPKPPEPQGLGAVVEDVNGDRWVRALDTPEAVAPWKAHDCGQWGTWAGIEPVRVLSEGWVRDA